MDNNELYDGVNLQKVFILQNVRLSGNFILCYTLRMDFTLVTQVSIILETLPCVAPGTLYSVVMTAVTTITGLGSVLLFLLLSGPLVQV